jgi:hypothetical protein
MNSKEMLGSVLTLAGLAAAVFGAMQGFEHGAWLISWPLFGLAVALLIVGYRLLLSRSTPTNAASTQGSAAAPGGEGPA